MSALEREIIEKFRQLDKEARQRVRRQIEQEADLTQAFDFKNWLESVQALQKAMRDKYGEAHRVDVVRLLREVREEEG